MRKIFVCLLLLVLGGCRADERVVAPSVVLELSLPAGLVPAEAACLDVLLTSTTGRRQTYFSFGANPSFMLVQTLDLDNDPEGIEETTRIRLLEGATPFVRTDAAFLLSRLGSSEGDSDSFTVRATVRRADGPTASDRCLEGTPLADVSADRDTRGQAIRFPAQGDVIVELPLGCVLPGGCMSDAGSPDAGADTDGGVADGGALAGDGGADTDAGVADGG